MDTHDSTTFRRCTKCGELKTHDQFSRSNSRKDGLQVKCKACDAAYRAANRDRIREYKHQYHIEHGDEIRERVRDWYFENHEQALSYRRRRHVEHRDQELARSRQWHINNRDRALQNKREYYLVHRDESLRQMRIYRIKNNDALRAYFQKYRVEKPETGRAARQRRKARERNLPCELTVADISLAFETFNHCCAVCERQLNGLFHRDHLDHWIPLRSPDCPGTVPYNMVPLCSDCNLSKGAKPADVWLVERFGERKGKAILKRIETFLQSRQVRTEGT